MNDKIASLLQQLADKLGVSATYLWQALLAQQRIDGIIYCTLAGALATLVATCAILLFAYRKNADVSFLLFPILGGVLAFCPSLYWGLTCLLNPAFGAFTDVQHLISR